MVVAHEEILEKFALFQGGTGGLDSWLSGNAPSEVLESLVNLENQPLTQARFNQLLTRSHEAPISDALFRYYWLSAPERHPYDVRKIPCFDPQFCHLGLHEVRSLDQLYWGLYRFYVDALLFFGSIRTAYQRLRRFQSAELRDFFEERSIHPHHLKQRGQPVEPSPIDKGERYLISEMACKSLDAKTFAESELANVLLALYRRYLGDPEHDPAMVVTAGILLDGAKARGEIAEIQTRLYLSADAFLDAPIVDETDLLNKIEQVSSAFDSARRIALANTKTYLSMVGDLDVYVATSMRTRRDFIDMADFCDRVFGDDALRGFNLRYFDPTLSAAQNHEDKGLIECLMVERAKVLVLQAGFSDSYGKDAEAAMALSLGKPVIIHAATEERRQMFSDTHPLARLVNFKNGVAVGAMVADSPGKVVELLRRIFGGGLEYTLDQSRPRYLVLKENVTGSVVRLQTSDDLIRETFWNHYQSDVR